MFKWVCTFIRRFCLAANHHRDTALLVETHNNIGTLVGYPDIVVAVDAHGMCIGPAVKVRAYFTQEFTV